MRGGFYYYYFTVLTVCKAESCIISITVCGGMRGGFYYYFIIDGTHLAEIEMKLINRQDTRMMDPPALLEK